MLTRSQCGEIAKCDPQICGSNDFQDYFDNAKDSRVKQVPKNQESKDTKVVIGVSSDFFPY